MSLGKGGQSGSQSGTQTTSGTTMPIVPEDWLKSFNGAVGSLGTGGISPQQQGFIGDIGQTKDNQGLYNNAGFYGLGDFSKNFGDQWQTPTDVTPQQVNAQTGASFMAPYQTGYTNDVVNSTLANYDQNAGRQLSGLRASRDASGAFGDRSSLADNQFISDSDMNRSQTEAALRDQGFSRAMQGGAADAGNFLTASNANASNKLAADTFNNNFTNNRQQFDINSAFQGDQNRMQSFRDQNASTLGQSGIASGGLTQLASLLGIGTGMFGQKADGTTNSTGNSSSKGGGLSIG